MNMSYEGILNIDKPTGMTSHDVVARVRRTAGLRRVGHTGTLDPLATGVLVVCLGRATRLVEYVVGRPKTYEAVVKLGQSTNTYDCDGEVTVELPLPTNLTGVEIEPFLDRFRGEIAQIPPMYSAIKKNGQPLYKLARQGIEIERPPRQVTIYELTLMELAGDQLSLRVTCSAGTYIRSIAHDLGELLGCGGHLIALRRTAVGSFTTNNGVRLEDLTPENVAAHLLPSEIAVDHLPRIDLEEARWGDLQHGRPISIEVGDPDEALVRVYDLDGQFAGLVARKGNLWRAHKLFVG